MANQLGPTEAQIAQARSLRAADPRRWSFAALGARFSCGAQTIRMALDPEWAAAYRERNREAGRGRYRPMPEAEERPVIGRAKRAALTLALEGDKRDLTGRILGDPLPGRSALDMRSGPGLVDGAGRSALDLKRWAGGLSPPPAPPRKGEGRDESGAPL